MPAVLSHNRKYNVRMQSTMQALTQKQDQDTDYLTDPGASVDENSCATLQHRAT